ncbi:MAG: M48 family metallopeptidase [Acidobacteria bacterium]|nr:M48 family metallopeptidase [Acidobacteriota bacterium]
MEQITVGNIQIDIVRKDIKNLHLAVYPPTGRVRIASPLTVDDEAVRLFAVSKLRWIKKHQKSFESQERQSAREYITGESHYFEGNRYLLNVIYADRTPSVEIRNKTHIDLTVRADSTFEQRKRVMTGWYRDNLKRRVEPLIEKWQKKIGVEIADWQIRLMKTKWGSCKVSTGRIWLNLELMKKPSNCLEYIIVHELLHFKVRHHNDKYLALLDKYIPSWRSSRDELNSFIVSYDEWKG